VRNIDIRQKKNVRGTEEEKGRGVHILRMGRSLADGSSSGKL